MIKHIYYIYIYIYIYICIYPSFSDNVHQDVTDFKFHDILRNKAECLKGGTWLFNEVKNILIWARKRAFWENIIL